MRGRLRHHAVRLMAFLAGCGAGPNAIRTNPGIGHSWWVNIFPVMWAAPEPPVCHGLLR